MQDLGGYRRSGGHGTFLQSREHGAKPGARGPFRSKSGRFHKVRFSIQRIPQTEATRIGTSPDDPI